MIFKPCIGRDAMKRANRIVDSCKQVKMAPCKVALMLLLFALPTFAQSNITASSSACATSGSCVAVNIGNSTGGATITISGTFSATLQFEGSGDGTNFASLAVTPLAGGSAVTSTTAVGTWQVNVAGLQIIRVRCSTYASGTAVVSIQTSQASARTGGGGSSAATLAGNANAIYLSPNCPNPSSGNCYFAYADAQFSCAAVFTNTSKTVTIQSTDPPFQSTDVGKIVYGITANGGVAACGGGPEAGNQVNTGVPQGTITAVNSATSITVSVAANANCNGASVACILVWGDDDTTNMQTWANAVVNSCSTGVMPSGGFIVQAAIGVTGTTYCGQSVFASRIGPTFRGQSPGNTRIFPTPNFSFTGCTGGSSSNACFFSPGPGTYLYDFTIWGADQSLWTQNHNNCLIGMSSNSYAEHVILSDYGSGSAGLVGICVQGSGYSWLYFVQDDGAGNTACQVNSANTYFNGVVCDDTQNYSLTLVTGAATLNSWGGLYGIAAGATSMVTVPSGATFISDGDFFYSPSVASQVTISSTGTTYLQHATFFQGSSPASSTVIKVPSGGKVVMSGSTVQGGATGISVPSGGSFIDAGGNTVSGTAGYSVAGTYIADGHSLNGACTGTASSSSTLGLYGTGPNETTTACTSTTIGSGVPMSAPRTLQNLVVTAGTGGNAAGSGVVTVLKNGSTTTLTCTIGTGTACNDGTHTVSVVAGDLVSIQFTTQSTETLANVKALVVWN